MKYYLFSAFVFLMSCNTSELALPAGDMVGFVRLVDHTGKGQLDASGVSVSIEGTEISTLTDASGRFVFSNVEMGTYNIVFEKASFGQIKQFGKSHVGGDIPALVSDVTMFEEPRFNVSSISTIVSDKILEINGEVAPVLSVEKRFVLYLSRLPEVSQYNFDHSHIIAYSAYPSPNFKFLYHLENANFETGEIVYGAIYIQNPSRQFYGYYDFDEGIFKLTGSKLASKFSFLMN